MKEQYVKIYAYILQNGMDILAAVLIFVIGRWVIRVITNVIEKIMHKSKIDLMLISFTKNIVYFSLLIVVIMAALNKLGVQTTSVIAVLGAAGLAVGLALQGSLSNFAAGVMIIIFRPFEINDTIETSGAIGKVSEIQIFTTVLTSSDDKKIIIPNAKITADKIIVTPYKSEVAQKI